MLKRFLPRRPVKVKLEIERSLKQTKNNHSACCYFLISSSVILTLLMILSSLPSISTNFLGLYLHFCMILSTLTINSKLYLLLTGCSHDFTFVTVNNTLNWFIVSITNIFCLLTLHYHKFLLECQKASFLLLSAEWLLKVLFLSRFPKRIFCRFQCNSSNLSARTSIRRWINRNLQSFSRYSISLCIFLRLGLDFYLCYLHIKSPSPWNCPFTNSPS